VSAYRSTRAGLVHVKAGADCGPIVPQESMPRAGEYRTALCCAACGACIDAPEDVIERARADERAYQRRVEREDDDSRRREKLRQAGVDVAALAPAPKRRARRMVQVPLFRGSST